MELTDKVTIPVQVMAREVGEEIVILDLAGGSYFGLDPVGARIWELMGEGRTLAEISATMLEEYEVTAEQLQGDVIKLAGELAERGLVLKV
ncbi:MAG: PqqD family protein [Dechloromonas sp.]|jgi:hypothetical protein|nr:PqqD family protein [Candidatus Dechloromonas phosphoritropha]MBP8788384.1 PqqD family protein [Azonexus sp.]